MGYRGCTRSAVQRAVRHGYTKRYSYTAALSPQSLGEMALDATGVSVTVLTLTSYYVGPESVEVTKRVKSTH